MRRRGLPRGARATAGRCTGGCRAEQQQCSSRGRGAREATVSAGRRSGAERGARGMVARSTREGERRGRGLLTAGSRARGSGARGGRWGRRRCEGGVPASRRRGLVEAIRGGGRGRPRDGETSGCGKGRLRRRRRAAGAIQAAWGGVAADEGEVEATGGGVGREVRSPRSDLDRGGGGRATGGGGEWGEWVTRGGG